MSCDVRSCDVPCNGHVVCSKWFCDNVVIESTILYYKVLLQYYSVLHSTTPVLLCTTKYYSSTTLYCKVLLQYYSLLLSTLPFSSTLIYAYLLFSTLIYSCSLRRFPATRNIRQVHQILLLPRKMTPMMDPCLT